MASWFDKLKATLRREADDLRESVDELTERGNRNMDERERELSDDPNELLRLEQDRIAASDDDLDEIRRRIEGD